MPDARALRHRRFPGEALVASPRLADAPPLDLAVVEWLERLFPEPAGTDPSALLHAMGARSVARRVRAEYQRQIEDT
jgi:hypothetical protein